MPDLWSNVPLICSVTWLSQWPDLWSTYLPEEWRAEVPRVAWSASGQDTWHQHAVGAHLARSAR
jgi:hypothetical protein